MCICKIIPENPVYAITPGNAIKLLCAASLQRMKRKINLHFWQPPNKGGQMGDVLPPPPTAWNYFSRDYFIKEIDLEHIFILV